MTQTLRHWRALLSIYIQDGLAYKASGIIWVLTDASTAFVMPLVLGAAAKGGVIQGYDARGFALYFLISLLVTSFVTCHFMWEIAFEVKEGQFSAHILRPISYLQFMAARNLAWRLVRTTIFMPILLLMLVAYSGIIGSANLFLGPEAFLAILLGHALSFLFVMAMAMIALFVQEATSIFELYYIPMLFLSGQMFPIALFPDWVKVLAKFTPFYYTTGFPTELIIGQIPPSQAWQGLGVQAAWCLFSYIAFKILFKLGSRQYTGVGM